MPTTAEQKADGWLSVTEVLDAFIPKGLLSWYLRTGAKEAKRLSTVAMKIGSRVDELIQEDVLKGSYKLSAKDSIEVKNCMEAWESFKKDYQLTVEACQIEVSDIENKIIGHIDLVMDGITDVKCASSIKPNYWLQVSKYRQMGRYSNKVNILRLDKSLGVYQFVQKDSEFADKCAKVFDGLLAAYRYYQPKAEKEE